MMMIWKGIVWIVFGFIVGLLARYLLPGKQPMPMYLTTILGIVGSIVGGSLYALIFGGTETLVTPGGWFTSILGGMLVLWVATLVMNNKPAA